MRKLKVIILTISITMLCTGFAIVQLTNKQFGTNSITIANHCSQDKISNQFDIEVFFRRNVDTMSFGQECIINIKIFDKLTKVQMDSINITSEFILDFMFLSCDNMKSFTTGFNSERIPLDNYYGDVVVADLNFDGKEDLAIVANGGGNSGPNYTYFIQNSNYKFIENKYLTDSMGLYPSKIDTINKTLTTLGHAGACYIGERIFKLDNKLNSWKMTSKRIIDVCK